MITEKPLSQGWLNLKCSVQGCPKTPEIALQVDRKRFLDVERKEEGVIPPPPGYKERGLPSAIAHFTPCPSDEGVVREYLAGRGYTPDMIMVIPKETIDGYAREEAEWESRRAGKERR